MRVEPVNPPPGVTPESLSFHLAPTYKSGLVLKLGREPRTLAVGRLIDAGGLPVAYLSIKVQRIGYPEEPAIETFTGRSGAFQIPNLSSGRYEIQVASPPFTRATVDISEAREGVHYLGDISLQ